MKYVLIILASALLSGCGAINLNLQFGEKTEPTQLAMTDKEQELQIYYFMWEANQRVGK